MRGKEFDIFSVHSQRGYIAGSSMKTYSEILDQFGRCPTRIVPSTQDFDTLCHCAL